LLEKTRWTASKSPPARSARGEQEAVRRITTWAKEKGYQDRIEVLSFTDGAISVDWMLEAGAHA
jgi:D-citramalate synthase